MLIKQSRILSGKYFTTAQPGSLIYIRVSDLSRFSSKIKTFGFNDDDVTGSAILPAPFNRYAMKNAEQFFVVNKNLPKEEYYQAIYWTRHEWAGRGETVPVTEITYVLRERYHRDYYAPYSVYFSLNREERFIVSEGIPYEDENTAKLINTVNMLLGLFGECEILLDEIERPKCEVLRLNWEILPKGECPWGEVNELIEEVTKKCNQTQKQVMLRDCKIIHEKGPDFVAYGRSGFRGYIVFGFKAKNLYVFESIYPNNATYIVENDWEVLSQLTKAQILSKNLHKARIIHSEAWGKQFNKVMRG